MYLPSECTQGSGSLLKVVPPSLPGGYVAIPRGICSYHNWESAIGMKWGEAKHRAKWFTMDRMTPQEKTSLAQSVIGVKAEKS